MPNTVEALLERLPMYCSVERFSDKEEFRYKAHQWDDGEKMAFGKTPLEALLKLEKIFNFQKEQRKREAEFNIE